MQMTSILKWNRFKNWMTLFVLCLPVHAFAAFCLQYSFFYNTWTDDVDKFTYSRMNNSFFVGASFDKNAKLYIGPNYHMITKSHKVGDDGETSDLSATAFGASALYFFDKDFRWKMQLTYNLSLKGTRTVSGVSQEIDGSGYEAGLGFQLPLNRHLWIGASLNYHAMTIGQYTVDNTTTDASQTYTAIVPMINLNFFFR